MNKKTRFFWIALACVLTQFVYTPFAQTGTKDTNQKQAAASIFDEIMQTLPADMKAKVDSASMAPKADPKSPRKNNSSANPQQSPKPGSQEINRETAVKELPVEVRGKVERAISEIDLMNQNRQIQFKEYEKKRLGNK
jgi:hypothetical protein